MSNRKTSKAAKIIDHAKEAARAHTDLNIFYAVITLLESGLTSSAAKADERAIIKRCKSAAQKCLNRYDRNFAAITKELNRGEKADG